MGSQERVGEFKCGFICSDSSEIKGNFKLLNSFARNSEKVGISVAAVTVNVIGDDFS